MNISAGNIIIIIGLILGAGVMIWQFLPVNQVNSDSDDSNWQDDMDATEENLEETEEFLRRMERLSKRTIKDDDKDRKK